MLMIQRRPFKESCLSDQSTLLVEMLHSASCAVFRVNKDAITSTVGFSNQKQALVSFREHETSTGHKASMLTWKGYRACLTQGSVKNVCMADEASSGHVEQLAVNVVEKNHGS